jgi:hypothetical protein
LLWFAALGPLGWAAWVGNVTILVAVAVLAGWWLLETRRDFLGGAILAAALFKPHLIVMLPLALVVARRWRALLGFAAVAAVGGVVTLVMLHPDGIRDYLVYLLAPKPEAEAQNTLHFALGGGAPVLAIEAVAVLAVILIAIHARKTRTAWPVVTSAVLGSFLLAGFWHAQDYLVLDAAAAIMLAAAPLETGVLIAAAAVIVSTPASPLTNWQASPQMAAAWLMFAVLWLGFLAARTLRPLAPPAGALQAEATSPRGGEATA